jgi:hypothetical protein
MEISVYHNLLFIGSHSKFLYVWDYEFFKLIGAIELVDCGEPIALQVINGYSVIILTSTEGMIFFINFVRKELVISF